MKTVCVVSYVLVMRNDRRRRISVGSLGEIDFDAGYYFYIGSARSGVHRVKRHFRKDKVRRWHIDYVLETFIPLGAVMTKLDECELARLAAKEFAAVQRFGRSDCRCYSHLFYSPILTLEFLPAWTSISPSFPTRT